MPNPKATAEGIKQQYINFGLNSRQIELLSELTQKREYYVSSIKGNRVFDLALQPLEAAFVTATSKEDQLKIQALEKNHLSKDEFILAWLDYKGMPEEKAKYQSLIEPEGVIMLDNGKMKSVLPRSKTLLAIMLIPGAFVLTTYSVHAAYPVFDAQNVAKTVKVIENTAKQIEKLNEQVNLAKQHLSIVTQSMKDVSDNAKKYYQPLMVLVMQSMV